MRVPAPPRRGSEPGGELADAPERGAGGAAGEDRFGAGELARGEDGVAVGRLHHVVEALPLRAADDLLVAQPLDERPARRHPAAVLEMVGEDRAGDVHRHDLHSRILLLEVARHAGDRAAGADAGDEPVDAALHLAPDLGAGRAVVRLVVGAVVVLVGEEGAGDLGGEPARHPVVAVRVLGRQVAVDQHELDAHRPQGVDLLAGWSAGAPP